jgi:hypothetical protein
MVSNLIRLQFLTNSWLILERQAYYPVGRPPLPSVPAAGPQWPSPDRPILLAL